MEIVYREGRIEDGRRLAELIDMASGGVLDFMFHDLVPDMTPVQVIARNLTRNRYPYTFKNAIVAEIDHRTDGMALSFPSRYHGVTEEMKRFFPADRLEHLRDFYAAGVENTLFLDALAVDPACRRRGIGRDLIAGVQTRARENGLSGVSLIAFADNTGAIELYRRCGFEVIRPVLLDAHALIPHEGGCLLMNCPISSWRKERCR